MDIARARPLCCFCWLFSIVIAISVCRTPSPAHLLGAAIAVSFLILLALIGAALFRRPRYQLFYASFIALGVLLGLICSLAYRHCVLAPVQGMVPKDGTTITIEGTIVSNELETTYINSYSLRADVPNTSVWQVDQTMVYLSVVGDSPFSVGDRVGVEVTLLSIEQSEETVWNIRYMQAQGFHLIAYADAESEYTVFERGVPIVREYFETLQHRLSYRLSNAVGGEAGKLAAALLLGTRDQLSDTTVLDFRRAGASHLLALSGMHLSMIVLILSVVLMRLRCPFKLRLLFTSASAIFFLFLTGCNISMVRATVMLLWLNLSRLDGSPHDALTPLSCFFAACLALEPMAIYDVALWLTVLATLAVVEIVPALLERKKERLKQRKIGARLPLPLRLFWRYLVLPLLSSCIVMLVLMIPMALSFGEFSLMTPLANVILIPLTTVCLALGLAVLPFLTLVNAPVIGSFVRALLFVLTRVSEWMLDVTLKMSDVRGVVVSLRYPFVKPLLAILLITLLCFLLLRWKRPRAFLLVAAAWIGVFFICLTTLRLMRLGDWHAVYTSQGNGELLCLEQNEQTVLCDVTDGSYTTYRTLFDGGLPDATTEIEAVVLTHYHARHVSSMMKLMGDYRVRTVWLPITMPYATEEKAEQDRGIMQSIAQLAQQRRADVRYYEPAHGATITGTLRLDHLYYDMIKRSTHPTVSAKWAYWNYSEHSTSSMLWLGASAWEGDSADMIFSEAKASEVWLLSSHGPKIKRTYDPAEYGVTTAPLLIVSSNEGVLDAMEISPALSKAVESTLKIYVGKGSRAFDLP